MSLNLAIQLVFKKINNSPLTISEITDLINKGKLFLRKDGNPVPSSQILNQIKNSPSVYTVNEDKISLKRYEHSAKISGQITLLEFLKNTDNHVSLKRSISDLDRLLLVIELTLAFRIYITKVIPHPNNEINKENLLILVNKFGQNKEYKGIFNKIFVHFEKFKDSEIKDLILSFSRVERKYNDDFEDILSVFFLNSKILEKFEFSQFKSPDFVNRLISNIVKPIDGELIYDPASGLGNTLLHVCKSNPGAKLIGQEINKDVVHLCQMNLFLNKCENFEIINSDSLIYPCVNKHQADIIISNPPFGGKSYGNYYDFERISKDSSSEVVFFEMMLSRLNPKNGKMAVVLPDSFLWKNSTKMLRKELIDNDKLEAVISLPLGAYLPYSAIKANLLILNNNKDTKRKNTFIFIDSNYADDSIKNLDVDDFLKEVLNIYFDSAEFSSKTKFKAVSKKLLIDQDYDFTVHKYLSDGLELLEKFGAVEKLIPLKEILTPSKNEKPENFHGQLKLVQIKDLNNSVTEFYLNVNKLKHSDDIRPNYKILSNSSLLIARIGDKLKPTYFEYQGESIAVINNIFTFEVNKNLVNIEYIISQLNSDIIKFQLDFNRPMVGVIPYINQATFLKLSIPLPSIIEQMERVANFKRRNANKSELIQFIDELKLVTTPEEIKAEIERFAKKTFINSEFVQFKTEFEFEKFPFTVNEIAESKYIKRTKDPQFRWFTYLLLVGENNQINGVLTIESSDEITKEQYSEINAFSNFIVQASTKYIQQNTNRLLNEFSHTTKNILKDIDKMLNDILETTNKELITTLKNSYIKDEKLINHLIKNTDRKKEDFIAFNRIVDAHNKVIKHFEFFKRRHLYYTNSVNSEFEIVSLKHFVERNFGNSSNINLIQTAITNETLFIKSAPIELAFANLLENAITYSTDQKIDVEVIIREHYIEFVLSNKSDISFSKINYESLGKADIKKSDGTYSTGLSNAFKAINEDNEISLAPYDFYKENELFKITIKLKKS